MGGVAKKTLDGPIVWPGPSRSLPALHRAGRVPSWMAKDEQNRRGRRSTQDRWFDAEEDATPAAPRSADNAPRTKPARRAPRGLTLLLLVLLGLLALSLAYLRDEALPTRTTCAARFS